MVRFQLSLSARLSVLFQTVVLILTGFQGTAAGEDSTAKDRSQQDYELMKLFVEVYEQIETNYVRDVDRRELAEAAIQGMLQHLDPYSSYIPREDVKHFDQVVEQEFGGVGIQVYVNSGKLTVVSPLPGSPAFRAGIRSGDVIVEVDGKSADGFTVNDAIKVLQGPPGRTVSLGFRRQGDNAVKQVQMTRELIQVPTVLGDQYSAAGEWQYLLSGQDQIGYIRISHFSGHTAAELRKAVDGLVAPGLRGLILDVRSNPGGLLDAAIEIADMFLESGDIVSVKGRNVPDRAWKADKDDSSWPAFPLAILVNRYSASASEVLSASLQDNARAIVVGERTWGKGSVQNVIRIDSGESALKLTTASYHRPSGVNIHRFPDSKDSDDWGVKPNDGFTVSFSSEQWEQWRKDREEQDVIRTDGAAAPERTFKDPQLEKALAWVNETLAVPAAAAEENADAAKPESGSEKSAD